MPLTTNDLALMRIHDAVRQLKEAARVESAALEAAMLRPEPAILATLYAAHRQELDAVQSLVTAAEILERVLEIADGEQGAPPG